MEAELLFAGLLIAFLIDQTRFAGLRYHLARHPALRRRLIKVAGWVVLISVVLAAAGAYWAVQHPRSVVYWILYGMIWFLEGPSVARTLPPLPSGEW